MTRAERTRRDQAFKALKRADRDKGPKCSADLLTDLMHSAVRNHPVLLRRRDV